MTLGDPECGHRGIEIVAWQKTSGLHRMPFSPVSRVTVYIRVPESAYSSAGRETCMRTVLPE